MGHLGSFGHVTPGAECVEGGHLGDWKFDLWYRVWERGLPRRLWMYPRVGSRKGSPGRLWTCDPRCRVWEVGLLRKLEM